MSFSGDSPAHMDPWSKTFEGWVTPTVVTGTLITEPIAVASTSPDVYQFLGGSVIKGEYFLVENRQRVGFDAATPRFGPGHLASGCGQDQHPGRMLSRRNLRRLRRGRVL